MKIQDIKNALNTKVSTLNVQAPQPTTPTPAPKANVSPAPVVTPRTEENPVKKESDRGKAKTTKVKAPVEAITSKDVTTDSIEVVVAKILKPNVDYGIIPGCKKPSLLKAGAEKLAAYFGFSTSISIENRYQDFDQKLVAYEAKVIVYDRTGKTVAIGYGEANSRERKFLKGDFYSQINTILKLCVKRSYVDGILRATSASSIFTQDMEDIANFQANQEQEAI